MSVHSFWFSVRLVRVDYQLFPLTSALRGAWTHHIHSASGYSVSEKVLFVRERRLLADREVDVNRLNTDYLLTCELQ